MAFEQLMAEATAKRERKEEKKEEKKDKKRHIFGGHRDSTPTGSTPAFESFHQSGPATSTGTGTSTTAPPPPGTG